MASGLGGSVDFDKFIALVYEELVWEFGHNKMAVVLVDLDREASGVSPCKYTLPSWWQPVNIETT